MRTYPPAPPAERQKDRGRPLESAYATSLLQTVESCPQAWTFVCYCVCASISRKTPQCAINDIFFPSSSIMRASLREETVVFVCFDITLLCCFDWITNPRKHQSNQISLSDEDHNVWLS